MVSRFLSPLDRRPYSRRRLVDSLCGFVARAALILKGDRGTADSSAMADCEKWSPLDEWNAREARGQAARLENGPPVRQREPRTVSGGGKQVAGRTKILGVIAVVIIGVGGYGTYRASARAMRCQR